jgi:hypothetical protein
MTSAVQWLEKQLSVTFKEMYAEEFNLAKAMEDETISKLKEIKQQQLIPSETLYTEEQVRELLYYHDLEIKKHLLSYPIEHSLHSKMCDGINDVRNEYIQSLKQPKKD